MYPNGTYANANTGMWLHHTVLETLGKSDAVCGNTTRGERFFASGNERSIVDICANGSVLTLSGVKNMRQKLKVNSTDQAGYYIGPKDEFGMLVELMNEIEEPRPVVVTITYEYIPNPPQSFSRVTPVWLDIGNCTDSDMPAFNDTTFQYSMNPPWKANFAGRVTFTGGHLHDGGTHLTILQNNNTICDSVASYGLTPGYIEPAGSMNMSGMNMGMSMMDISNMSSCENTGVVNVGDEFSVTAYYNTSEYAPMLNSDGTLAPIMGIALIYIAPGNATTTTTSNTASSTTSATGSASTTSSTSSATGSTSTTSSNGDRVMVGSAGVLLACIVMGFLM